MKSKNTLSCSITLAFLFLAHCAFAQATRTWVSGVGDDANPDSRTAPGKTFAGAISKTAVGGEIDALDPGGFGSVTITQSVTIDGGPGVAGVLVAGTPGIVINSPSTTPIIVTLRNLDIDGIESGTVGVQVLSPAIVHIENCKIYGFTGHGIDFEPSAAGSALYVQKSHIHDCGGDGAYLKPAVASITEIEETHIDDCAVGVHGDLDSITVVHNSSAVGNTGAGFETTVGGSMSIENSEASLNGTGISSAGTISMSAVTVTDNFTASLAHARGGVIKSFRNNPVGEFDGTKPAGLPTAVIGFR